MGVNRSVVKVRDQIDSFNAKSVMQREQRERVAEKKEKRQDEYEALPEHPHDENLINQIIGREENMGTV